MDKAYPLYLRKLKLAKLKDTKPRFLVLEELVNSNHQPISMAELLYELKDQVDRASVYRSVDILTKAGVIKKTYHGWKYKLELSDEFHGHHHHLSCKGCGTILSIEGDEQFEKQLELMARAHGFLINDHQLEIQGLCKTCQKL